MIKYKKLGKEITMVLHYSSNKDKKIFQNERLIKKYYGKDGEKISNRLSELRAANNLYEIPSVPPPRRHKLDGDKKNCWGIDYSPNDRIIIEPVGEFDIEDLKTITEVKIICLEDYH